MITILQQYGRSLLEAALGFYRQHERIAGPLFFVGGVTYDSLTIAQIDRFFDNFVLLLYLAVLGAVIVLAGRLKLNRLNTEFFRRYRGFFPYLIQFLLGGLFSAYAIYYFRSSSLSSTAVFFLLLAGLLVANEFLENRLMNLPLLLVLYTFVCCSFFVYFLPVILGEMGPVVFYLSLAVGVLPVYGVIYLIFGTRPARHAGDFLRGVAGTNLLVWLLLLFYVMNWIPPVPLSMKFGGVYHRVARPDHQFKLTYVSPPFYRFWEDSESPFRLRAGDRVHCFVSVFAPSKLEASIEHVWQHYRGEESGWVVTDRLPYRITGGREEGYRGYTYKRNVTPGAWRVNVQTEGGRVLGRVRFDRELEFTHIRR